MKYDFNIPCDELFEHARKVGGYKDCWAKAEEALGGLTLREGLEHPLAAGWGYYYACDVIHGRFPEAEDVIAKSAEWAYYYALDVLKGRFLEAEAVIANDAGWGYRYARNIIKDLDWIKEMNKNVRP